MRYSHTLLYGIQFDNFVVALAGKFFFMRALRKNSGQRNGDSMVFII